jgi:TrmH family RNA methyltransferase
LPSAPQFDRLSVVLVNTRNPLNMGAAARAMSNFGFFDLRVVKPYEAAFREAKSAVGASAVLARAREYQNLAEAIEDCSLVIGTTAAGRRELQHPLKPLDQAAKLIRKHLSQGHGRVAILFGSEKRGLSNEDFSHCHWLLRIPTREEHGSMNLGQAVAVCLYEMARSAERGAGQQNKKAIAASAGNQERVTTSLVEALHLSGYLDARPTAASVEKARRMVRRLNLSSVDAEVWLGILRQMVWKMKRND